MTTKVSVRRPFFMKMWENYPKTWKLLIDVGILVKFKTLNVQKIPDRITLPSSNVLYVNAEENRGRALLISGGVTQKRLTHFWGQAVKNTMPDLVIDVGVNYGECMFSTNYPLQTRIVGIEANSDLITYIKKSKEVHPNKSQMTIINAFVSDQDDEQILFYKDKHWSGTSSASYMPSHKMIEKVPVKTMTIDSIFHGDLPHETLLFKVDVEGYEAFVLKGMTGLFDKTVSAIGFIEFNSEYIEKSGIKPDEFILFLKEYFSIYIYQEDDTLVKADFIQYQDLQEMFGTSYVHTDFILVTNEEVMNEFDFIIE